MTDKKEGKKVGGSNISNTEWGMVISLLFIVDAIQIGLDLLFQIGVIINRFITFAVGLAWPTYLKLRGVNLNAPRAMSIIAAFFFEEIPDVDALPLWGLDGLVMYASVKAEKLLAEKTSINVGRAAVLASVEKEKAREIEAEEASAMEERTVGGAGGSEVSAKDEEGGMETEGPDVVKEKDEIEEIEEKEEKEQKEGTREQERERKEATSGGILGNTQTGESSKRNTNKLNLRKDTKERTKENEKEAFRTRSNLLDLSLSYGERKKQKEEKGNKDEISFPE